MGMLKLCLALFVENSTKTQTATGAVLCCLPLNKDGGAHILNYFLHFI